MDVQNEINKPIVDTKFILLIIGFILLLFASVLTFTRPAFTDKLDFTSTGQIGDTIGGITAPLMNLIGAVLIFISFKAQIKANKIQYFLLNTELDNQKCDRNFQVALELIREIKNDFKELKYTTYNNKSAIIAYSNGLKDKTLFLIERMLRKPIYRDWCFIIHEFYIILDQIDTSDIRENEKSQLISMVEKYYDTHISYSNRIMRKEFEKHGIHPNTVNKIKEIIEKLRKISKKQ